MNAVKELTNDLKRTIRLMGVLSGKEVTTTPVDLGHISREIERLRTIREEMIMDAFSLFEKRYANFADLLLQHFGDQRKAARWISAHQKAFGGRTGYDVIAEGDQETVWEEIKRMS